MNMIHSSSFPAQFLDSVQLFHTVENVGCTAKNNWCSMQSASMQYKPTLEITNTEGFQTRENDPENPVFGFEFIHYDIQIDSNDTKLKLLESGNYLNTIVLSNPWPNDWMRSPIHTFS